MNKAQFIFVSLVIFGIGLFIYGYFVEPALIIISKKTVKVKRLPGALEGFKIAHLADFHLRRFGEREKKIIDIVNRQKPDLVVITGDFVGRAGSADECVRCLEGIKARFGLYGVWGNEDHWVLSEAEKDRIKRSIIMLENSNRTINVGGASLCIIGVDDSVTDNDDLAKAMAGVPKDCPKLLLTHSPILAVRAADKGVAIALAGHTHGGQIYIPLLSNLLIYILNGGTYISGSYQVGGCWLYVNRGLGSAFLPMRLFSPPEIAFIRLRNHSQST